MSEPRGNARVPMMTHESAACLARRERARDVSHSVPVDTPVMVAPWTGGGLSAAQKPLSALLLALTSPRSVA
jgi:hypothetical protein